MEETTYLEDFLQSTELIPNDVRRDFELMREHDRECSEMSNRISNGEKKIFQYLKKIKLDNEANATTAASNNNEITTTDCNEMKSDYEEIKSLRNRLHHRALQKVSLASNMLKDIEQFINKLDNDLNCFEIDLRGENQISFFPRIFITTASCMKCTNEKFFS